MIILLNGSINAGKSTIAKMLAKKIPKTANIEVDELREFIHHVPLDDSLIINIENAALLAKNFVKNNYNVVITYPLYQQDHEYLLQEFKSTNQKVFTFTLSPKLEIALTNRGRRKLSEWELKRIKYHFKTGIPHPTFGLIIDNSKQTPKETTEEILKYISTFGEKNE